MAYSILIIEDDRTLADNIRVYHERAQWETSVAHNAEAGLKLMESMRPDVVVTDQMLPGKSGLEVIKAALAIDPQVKIVMLTGEGNTQIAVEAMKAGACDYLSKPISLAELKLVLEIALGHSQMEKTLSVLQRRLGRDGSLDAIIGKSPPVLAAKARARQVLAAETHVKNNDLPGILITGETGTGKELLARALHFEGARSNSPFIELNCASLPPNLLESELFGHERGAFTDAKDRRIGLAEAADRGTLFLDEIGEVDPLIQAKLLKLLEDKTVRRIGSVRERKVNIRIISATNQDLEKLVRDGRFRSDLYFRLRVITLSMPPLRSIGDDILLIAEHYLKIHSKRYGKKDLRFTSAAEQVLMRHDWPGNVRELRNMLEQTVLLATGPQITPEQLMLGAGRRRDLEPALPQDNYYGLIPNPQGTVRIADVERHLVATTLEKTDWNISKSAKLLGLSRDMLRSRIEKYGFMRPAG
ncbi:MAG: Response regulator with CheY-like receiver, AAA-type ATPase, and DNA-binding domain [Betaproteobacteria bacterium]|nr:Response regulator with CheY-like receiver, AAA-type ATPase, and DNA-binding domain [Betaproteobacteria bacterium]